MLNKLIWGDNLLVMGSLLEKPAGKIDLYIDPPLQRRGLISRSGYCRLGLGIDA